MKIKVFNQLKVLLTVCLFLFNAIIKTIFRFLYNSSIHVALAVYALTWITLIQFDVTYDENVFILFFCNYYRL